MDTEGRRATAGAAADRPRRRAAPGRRAACLLLLCLGGTARLRAAEPADPAATPASEQAIELAPMVVGPGRERIAEAPVAPSARLTAEDLASRPQSGGDVFRELTQLPGVTADDFTSKFRLRGAPNEQVLTLLDGVELLEPYHLKDLDGALSIIDGDTLDSVDLQSGGFTAEYGDRIAGVLTMQTPTGPALRPGTSVEASLLDVRVMNSGVFAGGKGRWLVAGRDGYPQLALAVEGRANQLSPRYYDLTGKVEYDLGGGQTLSLHALQAGDTMEARVPNAPPLSSRYGSGYLWARWRGKFGGGLRGDTTASVDRLTWRRRADGLFDDLDGSYGMHLSDRREYDQVGLRSDWSYRVNDGLAMTAGLESDAGWADYAYDRWRDHAIRDRSGALVGTERVAERADRSPWGTSVGVYAAPRISLWGRLEIEPGVRFDQHSYTGDDDWSPRLNASLALGRTTLRAGWGLYNQAQGLQELDVQDGDRSFHRAEQAEERILGAEQLVAPGVTLTAELYDRRTWDLRPYWMNLLSEQDLYPEAMSDRVLITPSREEAAGAEVQVRGKDRGPWSWSLGYTWAKDGQYVDGNWIPGERDQRDTVQAGLGCSPDPRWQFSAAWQYHTGWPVTDVRYELVPQPDGQPVLRTLIGPFDGERLPAYQRLDLRAERTFAVRRGRLSAFVDVFNAYDRTNLLGYEPVVRQEGGRPAVAQVPVKMFPLLPDVGARWAF